MVLNWLYGQIYKLLPKLKYNSFNSLVSKSKGTTSTYYVDKEYEVSETLTVQGSDIIVKKEMKHNIYAQNELVVTHTKTTIDNIKEVDITAYIHKDSLGSVDTVIKSPKRNRQKF